MKFAMFTSRKSIGAGLVALFAAVPLVVAQQRAGESRGSESRPPEPMRTEPVRTEPARAPVAQRAPVFVDRSNHGSLRHTDTHVVVPRPIQVQPGVNGHHDLIVHHDVDVDLQRHRHWHDFVFGRHLHELPIGCFSVFVGGSPYYYDDGIYYQPAPDGYQEVYPPVGADVPQLPDGAIAIEAGNLTYYYAGGAFYVQQDGGFVIAPPPMGVTVPELPPGAVQVSVNGNVAYQFNGIYYRPVFVDGVTQYMTFMP